MTGGNSGIGYVTCKAMYEAGATVYLACRDMGRGQQAIESIKKGGTYSATGVVYPANPPPVPPGARIECLQLDLADLNSVEHFAKDFQGYVQYSRTDPSNHSREKRLDVLFANAGVMAS